MGNLTNKLKFTNNIHVLRAEQRITQQDLADAIGVTRVTIISIEGGNYNPSLELAFRIANYFNKDIQQIFKITGEANEK